MKKLISIILIMVFTVTLISCMSDKGETSTSGTDAESLYIPEPTETSPVVVSTGEQTTDTYAVCTTAPVIESESGDEAEENPIGQRAWEIPMTVTVKADGREVEPYTELLYSFYDGHVSDGMAMFDSDPLRVLDKLERINLETGLEVVSCGVQKDKVRVYNAETGECVTGSNMPAADLASRLDAGTYIVTFDARVDGTGAYSGERTVNICYLCIVIK